MASLPPMIMNQTSYSGGQYTTRSSQHMHKSVRNILREQDIQAKTRHVTTPAFITQGNRQNQGSHFGKRNNSESSLCYEPAIMSAPSIGVVPATNKTLDQSQGHMYHGYQSTLPKRWIKLFDARQKDLNLSRNIEVQFQRFTNQVYDMPARKLILREMGFGASSAKALSKIIRKDENLVEIDLSMNNLSNGLESLVFGISNNYNVISVKLKNNSIDGRKN